MSDAIEEIKRGVEGATRRRSKKQDKPVEYVRELQNLTLPEGCPVTPLGHNAGVFCYLDEQAQVRMLPAAKHQRTEIMALYGSKIGLLYEYWPRLDERGRVSGWKPELAAQVLMEAAARAGIIDITERVRGPGAWLGENGELVMHCGDTVIFNGEYHEPGKIGKYIYPAAPSKPRPAKDRQTAEAGQELLKLISTWNWRRSEVDPALLLGWIAAAMIGGALPWRPAAWVTGDKATGKSTLQYVINHVIGEGAMIFSSDATAAGIWQSVGMSSLPVSLDEIEAEEDNRRNSNIINLARQAASGGIVLRGGSDHGKVSFKARSCFLFSSILIPPLRSQDVSRLAILQLDKLHERVFASPGPARLEQIGAALRRRLIEQWPRFNDTLECYRVMLTEAGHGARGADQFGTLMACHDLLLYDEAPRGEALDRWKELFRRSVMSEAEDDIADWERCFTHLMTSTVGQYRGGELRTVGSLVLQAAGKGDGGSADEANRVLCNHGMRVVKVTQDVLVPYEALQVANSHQGLASIFKDTHWGNRSGTTGVWVQSLRRIPGSYAGRAPTKFNGASTRFTEIPLAKLLEEEKR
jgi:hypothetical protein